MSNLSDFLGIPDFIPIELLVVGGGGGGGHVNTLDSYYSSGGGAGQLIYGNTNALTSITYNITVGTGGTGMVFGNSTSGSEGQPSFFGSIKAFGGGRGGYENEPGPIPDTYFSGSLGGTGGGSSSVASSAIPYPKYVTPEFIALGNIGGSSTSTSSPAGQGGGAGGVGLSNVTTQAVTNGLDLSITGTTVTYASGGQTNFSGLVTAPPVNLGQGGKGGKSTSSGGTADAQDGGSGVVIIAYPDTYPVPLAITGTYDEPTRAGYRVYRWTAGTGTVKF